MCCDGIVVDAHVMQIVKDTIPLYEVEEIDDSQNYEICSCINWILENCGIAINDYIETHWEQRCGKKEKNIAFWTWYAEQYNDYGRIIPYDEVKCISSSKKKAIRTSFTPKYDCFFWQYLNCANSTEKPRFILTNDYSLFSTIGSRKTKTKNTVKRGNTGELQVYIAKNLNIDMIDLENFLSYFKGHVVYECKKENTTINHFCCCRCENSDST